MGLEEVVLLPVDSFIMGIRVKVIHDPKGRVHRKMVIGRGPMDPPLVVRDNLPRYAFDSAVEGFAEAQLFRKQRL